MKTPRSAGFALISTLAVLVVVSILVVAYTTTIRTERGASVNFSERERADAIGQAMVSRLLSDHATPKVGSSGKRLLPFAVDPKTLLPTPVTNSTYFAENPSDEIYTMKPQVNLSSKNSLVRISQPETGDVGSPAFTPYYWAHSRVNVTENSDEELKKAFLPHDSADNLITPQWVDYYAPEDPNSPTKDAQPVPVGEVAFAIWDESGKIDINMAGADLPPLPNPTNGMAPHDLGWEKLTGSPEGEKALLDYLNGGNAKRERNNFSLRQISTLDPSKNRIGDDRWLFSIDELVNRKLFPPDAYNHITTYSRDFDVRPEWDGNRSAQESKKFLRSYINNPDLFRIYTYPGAGPHLVQSTFNKETLAGVLKTTNDEGQFIPQGEDDGLQIMRLMAALRQILPPTAADPFSDTGVLPRNEWTREDIYGIALNIAQASAPPLDQNLFAFNRKRWKGEPYQDPILRLGVRLSPYITEVAVKVKRINADRVDVTEYFEIWNPYPIDFSQITFRGGSWTGGDTRLPSRSTMWQYKSFTFTGPKPYSFKVVQNTSEQLGMGAPAAEKEKYLSRIHTKDTDANFDVNHRFVTGGKPFTLKSRPYIFPTAYWAYQNTHTAEPGVKQGPGGKESIEGAVSNGCFWEGGDWWEAATLVYCIEPDRFNQDGEEAWASFQIDDPRMGPFTRMAKYDGKVEPEKSYIPKTRSNSTDMWYSWKYYPDSHSLPDGKPYSFVDRAGGTGVPAPGAGSSRIGSSQYYLNGKTGYNRNFGENWTGSAFSLEKAMDTFALPGRPFLNLGELGTVFLLRPWRTLTFAGTSSPNDTTLTYNKAKTPILPAALLDYYTTIGTTTAATNIPFHQPADVPPDAGAALTGLKVADRKQSKIWLFEEVQTTGAQKGEPVLLPNPTNLRPIRGRINLNSASKETLETLLKAPYRLPRSLGLENRMKNPVLANGLVIKELFGLSPADLQVTVPEGIAEQIAAAIVGDPAKGNPGIRPLRSMADLGRLDIWPLNKPANLITRLHRDAVLPDPVIDAMVARLAQFGTVRQQIFRVDMTARSLNRNVERQRLTNSAIKRVVTAEVRFQTRLYFDTFSRKAFVESIEYR